MRTTQPARRPAKKAGGQKSEAVAPYLTYTRKEARLTDDQLTELTRHARRLNKAKQGAGERITENTLIRVAVDLLLARANELDGGTEDELRQALNL